FGAAKHLPIPLVRQAHADDLLFPSPALGLGFSLRRLGQFINPIFQSMWFLVRPIYTTSALSNILPGCGRGHKSRRFRSCSPGTPRVSGGVQDPRAPGR
ncbi:MAG: hypothetical protein WBH94_07470, partial [Methanoculleus sp.]